MHIYTMKYYLAIIKYEIVPFSLLGCALLIQHGWALEIAILSEVSQTEKDRYHTISLLCGVWIKMIQMSSQNRSRFIDL